MPAAATTGRSATFTERDVKKGITEMIAMDTPFTSTVAKRGPRPLETTPEWEMKTYAAPRKTGVVEGYKPGANDFENNLGNKFMLKGRFIKQWRPVAVTKEMQLMGNQYNRPNALQDNIVDKTKELYVDVEAFCLSDLESVVPAAGVTASSGRGLFRWLSNENDRFSDAATTPVAGARTPATSIIGGKAAASNVQEADVSALITSVAKIRKAAGRRFMGLCTPEMRDRFDSFSKTDDTYTTTSYPVSRFAQKQGSIDRQITFYKSANGAVELMTSFQLDEDVHFGLVTPDLVEIRYAQPVLLNPDHSTSAQVKEREIDVIYVLECTNPQAHGKITVSDETDDS
jgi:hypothetical protein